MFYKVVIVGLLMYYLLLWSDFMSLLIYLEVMSLWLICVMMMMLSVQWISLDYFVICLVFLVSESALGFMMFIFYVSMESEVVKKLNLIQF